MKKFITSNWFLFLVFAAAAFVLYSRSFSGAWLMDDYSVIVNNPDIKSFSGFLHNSYPGRPLREITFLLDYSLFGLQPLGYHFQDVFWHLVNGFLLYLLAWKIGRNRPVALFSALLFLVHPVLVEVVVNTSHRKDSLALAFCLLAFYAYRGWRQADSRRLLAAALAVVCFGLALTAKQNAVALIPFLVLYELFYRDVRKRLPVIAGVVGLGVLAFAGWLVFLANSPAALAALKPGMRKLGYLGEVGPALYYQTVLKSWAFLAGKLVWPSDLGMDYWFSLPTSLADPWVLAALLLVTLTIAGLVWSYWRKSLLFLPLAWLTVFWLPTSNLFGQFAYFAADRYWYAPSVGAFVLAGAGLWVLTRGQRTWFWSAAGPLLLVLAVLTWVQQGYWHDEKTFYTRLQQLNPESSEAAMGLGNIHLLQGDLSEARRQYDKALELVPGDGRVYQNLGYIDYLQKHFTAAIDQYRSALAATVNRHLVRDADIYLNLGLCYDEMAKPGKAEGAYKKCLELDPTNGKAYRALGFLYARQFRLEPAAANLEKAVHYLGTAERPYYQLGMLYTRLGRAQKAYEQFEMANRFHPGDKNVLFSLGASASMLGKPAIAGQALNQLQNLDPALAGKLRAYMNQQRGARPQ